MSLAIPKHTFEDKDVQELEDPGIAGIVILKWILKEKEYNGVDLNQPAHEFQW
jgi:hypothetical protein